MEKVIQRVQKFMKRLKATEGVTLIELLAVVVILAIVAAVAVPAVLGQISKSKTNADAQDEQVIVDAIQRLVLDAESNGSSGLQIGKLSSTGAFIPVSTTAVDISAALIEDSNGPLTASDGKHTVKDLLTTGLQNNGTNGSAYLSTWPTPQSNSATAWDISTGTATTKPNQTFSIDSTTCVLFPGS